MFFFLVWATTLCHNVDISNISNVPTGHMQDISRLKLLVNFGACLSVLVCIIDRFKTFALAVPKRSPPWEPDRLSLSVFYLETTDTFVDTAGL